MLLPVVDRLAELLVLRDHGLIGLRRKRDLADLRVVAFRGRRDDETSATSAAHLSTLAASLARFLHGPLVRRFLLMRTTTAFRSDLTLFRRVHRSESTFFRSHQSSYIHNYILIIICQIYLFMKL